VEKDSDEESISSTNKANDSNDSDIQEIEVSQLLVSGIDGSLIVYFMLFLIV